MPRANLCYRITGPSFAVASCLLTLDSRLFRRVFRDVSEESAVRGFDSRGSSVGRCEENRGTALRSRGGTRERLVPAPRGRKINSARGSARTRAAGRFLIFLEAGSGNDTTKFPGWRFSQGGCNLPGRGVRNACP